MKSLLLLLVAITASVSLVALAQSSGPTPPGAALSSPAPTPAASPAGSPGAPEASSVPLPGQPAGPTLEKTLPLMPESVPGRAAHKSRKGGEANAGPDPSPHGTFEVEQDIRLHIRIRQAETRAKNDPAIRAYWVAAHTPATDPARRTALTAYYNHFYDRVIQLDPSVATLANTRRQSDVARMEYLHLGDAELPVEPNPFATTTPDADPGGKNPPLTEEPPLP